MADTPTKATPDTSSVMDLIIKKIVQDKLNLVGLLESKDDVTAFDKQLGLLLEYQGGVQALHVLSGKMTADGKPIQKPTLGSLTSADLTGLEQQLRDVIGIAPK